jgi:hypothetical protein
MNMALATSIKEGEGGWTVVESMTTPGGEVTDTAVLDKITLAMLKRSIKQGPMAIDYEVKDGKLNGTMNMGGQSKPLNFDLGGELFADAGAGYSIAALPLADGYTATFRNFDVQKQKVKLMQLKVAGSESVTVPAGSFDSWKVELSSADGGPDKATVWVSKEGRKMVKMSTVLAQMGGAVVTSELQ